jgi:hypothetical protein
VADTLVVSHGILTLRAFNWETTLGNRIDLVVGLASAFAIVIEESVFIIASSLNTLGRVFGLNEPILAITFTEMISNGICIIACDLDALGAARVLSHSRWANAICLLVSSEIRSITSHLDADIVDGSGEDLESRLASTKSVFISL